ncbi:MAG: pyruvate kinase, partial [Clostridiales bacterium]|nr:pyruvate kinase [Clostridiales bacterium]
MATINNRVSTGMMGLDKIIDMLRLGDNVVWQVGSVEEYRRFVDPYVKKAKDDCRNMIYIRFGTHPPVIDDLSKVKMYTLDAEEGFEAFATKVHNIITNEGKGAFYVFDCLTELLRSWFSDLMIGNFFKVTCPYLFELDTIAYFSIIRNSHTYDTIARIRETTQLLIDLYEIDGDYYVHPLKVWERYAPTMFFPHLIKDDKAISITASADSAALFAQFNWSGEKPDYWEVTFEQANSDLSRPHDEQEKTKELLIRLLLGKESRMADLCKRYFTLEDMINIKNRQIGTGFIGGKSVGMLLARKILQKEGGEQIASLLEPHDSFYLGSDIFYTYIVQNGWWKLRTKQKTPAGYFRHSEELKKRMLEG